MHITATLAAAMSLTALSSTALAGGLNPPAAEPDVTVQEVVEQQEPEAASSVPDFSPTLVIAGLLAAVLVGIAVSGDD